MNRLLHSVVAVAAALGIAVSASAGIVADHLTFDGNPDTLNDNSRTKIIDVDNNGYLSIGDRFVGLFQIEKFNGSDDPSPAGVFGVVAFEVKSLVSGTGGVGSVFSLGAVSDANNAFSLKNVLDPALHPAGWTDADWEKTVGIVVEIPDLGVNSGTDDAVNPYDAAHSESDVDIIKDAVTAAKGWKYVMALGTETTNPHGYSDFFYAKAQVDFTTSKISDIEADSSGTTILTQKAALTILDHTFGAGVTFLPVGVRKEYSLGPVDTFADFVLKPDGSVQTTDLTSSSGWSVVDDGNFEMNAVPEPTSLLAWVGLVTMAGVMVRRRRR